jgi:hypothetical protein
MELFNICYVFLGNEEFYGSFCNEVCFLKDLYKILKILYT